MPCGLRFAKNGRLPPGPEPTPQERENLGHQGQGFSKLGASGREHHHRDLKLSGVLLKTQIAVCRQENLEFLPGQFKQLAVFDAAPAHFLNGHAIMPG